MKTYILFGCLVMSSVLFPSFSYADTSLRDQVIALPNGEKLVTKIHTIADTIVEKTKDNTELQTKIRSKITQILDVYTTKTDPKSQKIVIIFQYLQSQVNGKLQVASSRILQRLEKIEVEKYKKVSSSRVNKLKKKSYDRIQIKK